MAPALTAEPLSPKEKLTNSGVSVGVGVGVGVAIGTSPATGTRQSVRKLESPSAGSGVDTAKKPVTTVALAGGVPAAATTRVTRSKDAAQRMGSPIVQANNNNKRKTNNNNNNSSGSEVKASNNQMGLSAAATHTSNDGSAASSSNSSTEGDAVAAVGAAAAVDEHNNNSTAELLANLTSNFEEAITAEICLRKTLPEVSLSKEQPSQTVEAAVPSHMAEPPSQSTSAAAAAALAATTAAEQLEQQKIPRHDQDFPDNIEERLSQLDGSPSVILPSVMDISAATLVASMALPTPPSRLEEQQQQLQQFQQELQEQQLQTQHFQSQQLPPQQLKQHQLQPQLQQQQLQPSPELLASPQNSAGRQSGASLTPQSTASTMNFLKDGAAGAVLEDQDIEEVLKALKTLDGAHVNPDTICDFNFFNEVCFLNNEEDAAAAAAAASGGGTTTTTATGAAHNSLAQQEEEDLKNSTEMAVNKRPWQECHAEVEDDYSVLERKIDHMLQCMRKFQARHMCRHASYEMAGILEWSARTSHKAAPAAPVRSSKLTEQEDTVLSIVSGRPASNFWEEQINQPLSGTQMCNVMRHIETSAKKQEICHTIGGGSASLASSSSWYSNAAQPGKRSRKAQQLDAISNSSNPAGRSDSNQLAPRADEIVPNFDSYVTSELNHVFGLLHTEMREVQNAIDSDATESSSGGESADEMVNYNNSQQLSLPIARRAVWRYSKDRAAIALRWSWLRGQIADLDIKIRQHNEVYADLSRNKGDVLLESTQSPKNGYNKEQAQQMQIQPHGLTQEQQLPEPDWLCSRARPLVLSEFRKRKLFQTTNMHTISKKAARPANIKCGCQWPQVPCTLCTGRADPTAPRELPETLMPQNRVALLDAGYHPVLSFTDDVTQSVHLEAISRQPDWQYRVMRCQAKAIVKSVFKAEREAVAASGGGVGGAGRKPGDTVKRRYVRRKERNNNKGGNRNNNNNNNNNKNNNNKNSKETISAGAAAPTTTTQELQQQQQQQQQQLQQSSAAGVGVVDSGNGTGTATTSSSSTPTTTPLVANMAKTQRQSATTSGIGSLNLPLPDSSSKQQLNNSSLISSGRSTGNGAKKPRKSASTQQQQQQQQQQHHSAQSINTSINNNKRGTSQQKQSTGDSQSGQQQQQNNRRNSSEPHGQRTERTTERRSRLIYDIDNIVIPYSMAAQTRVEILPYKEIPTPKWRIVVSGNEKNQQAMEESKNTEKLSNGCATQAETEKAAILKETPAAATSVAAATAPTATTIPAATAIPVATTIPAATAPATEIAAVAPLAVIPKESDAVVKPPIKINGLKQSNTTKTLLEPPNKAQQQLPLSNGLVNGKEQKEKEAHKEAEQHKEREQPKEKEKDKEQPPAEQTTPMVNGKTKKKKNKKKQVNKKATDAPKAAPLNSGKKATTAADVQLQPPPRKRSKLQPPENVAKPISLPPVDEDEVEDISDEAYIVRHQRAMIEERLRFETFLKFPWSTRSRANRRVDSRAESSGANTPDPASPAASLLAGPVADNESIPSPLAQVLQPNPLDALNTDTADVATTAAVKRQGRRRTNSSKLKEYDRRSMTPDTREFQQLLQEPPPFEPLHFPLSDEVYQRLLDEMNAEPKEVTMPTVSAPAKRTKSKSVSSNGGDGNSNNSRRRSSKAKSANSSKLAQTAAAITALNGGRNAKMNGGKKQNNYDNGVDYDPEEDDDDDEEELLLLEEDDDYHYLAPKDDDEVKPKGVKKETSLYNSSIDAYLGEQEGLDEEELADDPFMDDDPNDPEWKRSAAVRHDRTRKRV